MAKRGPKQNAELKFRLPEELRAAVEQAARQQGLSMNSELLRRLNISFGEERALGGREMAGLVNTVVAAFTGAARMYAPGDADWRFNREAYRRGVFAALDAMLASIPDITHEEIALEIESLKGRLLTRVINEEKAREPLTSALLRSRARRGRVA